MNIPPKYEDLVAKLDAALGREADLIDSANQNKLMMDAACGEIATLQEELAEFELVQQRLTVAEQRAERFEALLLESNELFYAIQDDLGAVMASVVDVMRGKVFTALKPAEDWGWAS